MKLIDVEENKLTKSQLDYATAVAIGWEYRRGEWVKGDELKFSPACAFKPSTDWGNLGIAVEQYSKDNDLYITNYNWKMQFDGVATSICYDIVMKSSPCGYQRYIKVPEGEY